jgi:hypothetical protein
MYTKLSASRAYVYAVARACDAGHVSRRDCAGVILYSSDRAVEVTSEAMQSLGGNGYINEYPVARMLRDSRLYTVGAGTQEIRRMLIGRTFNEGECRTHISLALYHSLTLFPSSRAQNWLDGANVILGLNQWKCITSF